MPNPLRRIREAIVLAGGFGTRLAHVVSDVPKPMAPVAGRPFLRFVLDQLAEAGVRKVVIADGYKRECIEEFFKNCYRGMDVLYSVEDEPLLTGGAIKKAMSLCEGEWVYVLNGDTYIELDFDEMEETLNTVQDDADAVIACKWLENFDRYGVLQFDSSNQIAQFCEKQHYAEGWINAGAYLVKSNVLEGQPDAFSFENSYLETRVSNGRFFAYRCNGLFIDIGIPEDYALAQSMLSNIAKHWKIAFFDRDGTINVDTGHLHEPEKLKLINDTVDIMKRYANDPDWKIVVVTNQAGIAKGLYTVDDMHRLHEALDLALFECGVRVDAYYYCPHHPDFTGSCSCRKPEPGMILKALGDYDALPEDCRFVGDSTSDELAACQAGIQDVYLLNSGDGIQ